MGYMKIPNLYKSQSILELNAVYALEKIHGTSAHIKLKDGVLSFYSGGAAHEMFISLFNHEFLKTAMIAFGQPEVIVFGEAYGGKMQGMKDTYGDELKFVVFDVQMNGNWLTVPHAHAVATMLKLEFVDYVKITTKLAEIDAERDRPSVQAIRNGLGGDKKREGVVLRPIEELVDLRGNRIIVKHKNAEFCETKTRREVDPNQRKVLDDAREIADEWVTPMRLKHVLDRAQALLNNVRGGDMEPLGMQDTKTIINMMVDDIKVEAKGEILESREAIGAIGRRTAHLYHEWLQSSVKETSNGR